MRKTSPPAGFNIAAEFQGIPWHQRWEVFENVFTPGGNPVDVLCGHIRLPQDLSGKRVLDIGAWNGCFSFECERRGAKEVVALSLENPDKGGFNRLKALLKSNVRYVQGSVYGLDPALLGQFDVVLFLGVLYHLRYPLLAIDRIRTVARGDVYIETHVVSPQLLRREGGRAFRRFSRRSSKAIFDELEDTPIWRQYREFELNPKDQNNWFGPNIRAVEESFESAGFRIEHLATWNSDRAAFHATLTDLPERMRSGSYEGMAPSNAQFSGIPTDNACDLFRD